MLSTADAILCYQSVNRPKTSSNHRATSIELRTQLNQYHKESRHGRGCGGVPSLACANTLHLHAERILGQTASSTSLSPKHLAGSVPVPLLEIPTSLEEAKIFLRRTIVEIGMKIRLPSARLRSKSHSQQRPPAAPPWPPWPLELEKDSLYRSSRRHPKLNSHTQ